MISLVKAIIFDADGVLLDSLSIWRNLENDILQILDITQLREWKRSFSHEYGAGAAWLKSRFALGFSEERSWRI